MKDNTKIISIGQIDLSSDIPHNAPTLDDLPVIPLRDMVLFPQVTFPIMMGRELTVRTVNAAYEKSIPVGVFCQTDPAIENPDVKDLYPYGVVADVVKVIELPDGTHTAILNARSKVKVTGPGNGGTIPGALSVSVKECRETNPRPTDKEFAVLVEDIRSTTLRILGQNGENPSELMVNIKDLNTPPLMINLICTHAGFELHEKMDLLRHSRLKDRAMHLMSLIARQEQFSEIRSEIRRKAMKNIDEQQRNHYLQHEFEVLRDKLYGNNDDSVEFEKKAEGLLMPQTVRDTFKKKSRSCAVSIRRVPTTQCNTATSNCSPICPGACSTQ